MHIAVGAMTVAFGTSVISVSAAELERMRIGRHPGFTRVVYDLSEAVDYDFQRDPTSGALIINLAGVTHINQPLTGDFANTPIVAIEHAQPEVDRARLSHAFVGAELDVTVFSLRADPDSGRGFRVVLDIEPAGASALEEVAESRQSSESQKSQAAQESQDFQETQESQESQENTEAASRVPATPQDAAGDQKAEAAVQRQDAPTIIPPAGPIAEQQRDATLRTATAPVPTPDTAGARSSEAAGIDIAFSGTWQHEWAWNTESSESQKFESFIEPRWDISLGDGLSLTAIGRVRLDSVGDLGPDAHKPENYSDLSTPWMNSAEAELSLREFYVDFSAGATDFRIGKQQIVWGQADGFKVLDVVNPQSFREFILDDFDNSRIPLWSLNATTRVADDVNVQFIWIPDTTYHELAELGTPYALSTPRLIPQVPIAGIAETDKPDDPLRDSDVGAAITAFAGGWDLSLNYLYRYLDNPLLSVRFNDAQLPLLTPEYARSHLLGGTFSNAFGSITLRGEFGYNSHSYHATNTLQDNAVFESPEFTGVLGLDWLPDADTLLSVQWFNSYLLDYANTVNRDRNEQLVSAMLQRDFFNATWRFRGIALHSPNDGDTQLQLRLSYWMTSSLQLMLGADVFSGNELGLFGQFDDQDRLVFGFEYGF